MTLKRVALIFILGFLVCGCASVFKGTNQAVSFQSDPEGAEILLDGKSVGVTPLVTNIKKNSYSVITAKKDGYTTVMAPMGKSYDGVALLNVLWDFSTTDLITGAMFEYNPGQYYFKMKKEGAL